MRTAPVSEQVGGAHSASRPCVLHIITGLDTGGAETSLTQLALSSRDEVRHVVVSLTTRGTQATVLDAAGVEVIALGWRRGRLSVRGVFALVKLVRRLRPDVIHGWMYHANFVTTLVALMTGMRARHIWSIRHSLDDLHNESRALRLVIGICKRLSSLPAAVLYNSRNARSQHVAYGFSSSRALVIPNGFDTTRFRNDAKQRNQLRRELGIDSDTPVVALVARVHSVKDHDTFLAAAALVKQQLPNARFLLAGRGTDDPNGSVLARARELGVADALITLGDRRDTEAVYNAADVVALTSRTEAFPNTLGEAMSCGVSCVTTDVGDAKWIVGDTGAAVPRGDAPACAREWLAALQLSPSDRQSRGQAARQRIETHFSLSAIGSRYTVLWRALIPASGNTQRVLHVLTADMSLHFLRGQRVWFGHHGVDLHVACSPGGMLDAWNAEFPGTGHAIRMKRQMTPLRDVVALFRLSALIRRLRVDVVHAGTPKGGLLGTCAAWLCGVPKRIYHVRGLPLTTARGAKRHILRATEQLAVAASTHLLAVSNSLRDELHREGIVRRQHVNLIGAGSSNGVDATNRFNPDQHRASDVRRELQLPESAPVVGFVGRLTRDKGIAELAHAWRSVRSEHPTAHLLVVGELDDAHDDTKHACALLRADSRVRLHGADWDTPRLYAAMDILVLPTYREGFPNVLLEAAAMRIPVIATTVAGCVDAVVHGETGLLVPPQDASALTRAIDHYIRNAPLRRQHGAAARTRVLSSFEQTVIWRGLAKMYGVNVAASHSQTVASTMQEAA